MPESSGRDARPTGRRRLATGLCALLFAACSGGSGGGSAGAPAGDSAAAATTSVSLAWGAADGPVAGYSVYVQRDGGKFDREIDVVEPNVTLTGPPGQQARVAVAAFDQKRKHGPSSPPSPVFTFPPLASEPPASTGDAADGGSGSSALPADDGTGGVAGGEGVSGDAEATDGNPPEDSAGAAFDASDLAGALVWQAGDALRLTDASLETLASFPRPATGAQLVAVADVDGDGLGDLVWVDANASVAYTPTASLQPDTAETPAFGLGALAADERVLGAADLDGDGHGDLIVQRASESVYAWFTAADAAPQIVALGTAAQAALAGVGDFDASGSDDIAWRSPEGALVLWLMDGTQPMASIAIGLGSELEVLGAGDFDGNGVDELAVRDPNGDVFAVHPLSPSAVLSATDLADTLAWRSVGAADLDRDGSDELVLAVAGAIRIAALPGDEVRALDPDSPWALVALLR